MNRVIDLPALHVYLHDKAVNGKVTVEAADLAEQLGISRGTMYTALREMVSEGRLSFAYKTSARHPVYEVADPASFAGTTVGRPPVPRTVEATPSTPRGRKPAWG